MGVNANVMCSTQLSFAVDKNYNLFESLLKLRAAPCSQLFTAPPVGYVAFTPTTTRARYPVNLPPAILIYFPMARSATKKPSPNYASGYDEYVQAIYDFSYFWRTNTAFLASHMKIEIKNRSFFLHFVCRLKLNFN